MKDLKLNLYQEREQQEERDLQRQWQHQQIKFLYGLGGQEDASKSLKSFYTETRCQSHEDAKYAPLELVTETSSISCRTTNGTFQMPT